jgi:hypothetical protein
MEDRRKGSADLVNNLPSWTRFSATISLDWMHFSRNYRMGSTGCEVKDGYWLYWDRVLDGQSVAWILDRRSGDSLGFRSLPRRNDRANGLRVSAKSCCCCVVSAVMQDPLSCSRCENVVLHRAFAQKKTLS